MEEAPQGASFRFLSSVAATLPTIALRGGIIPEWLMKSGVFSGWSMEGVKIE